MNTPDVWIQLLDTGRVRLDPGLTADEIADVERRYAFTFAPVHRRFLVACLPVDDGWVDWR